MSCRHSMFSNGVMTSRLVRLWSVIAGTLMLILLPMCGNRHGDRSDAGCEYQLPDTLRVATLYSPM